MKKLSKISLILLALLGVLFTSCKKDYPEPPIQVLPVGTVYTIGEILEMESGTVFNEDASVYGIVTADERSGNLYKAAFMQDRATGKAIELYLNATSGVRIGDSIRVYLKDVTYSMYNGLPQLNNFEADGHIVILANEKYIEPTETTIANIVAGNHLAGLVKLTNVMFTEQNTFADPNTYGNRTLVDPSNFSQSVIVRTSNYANFANDSLPQGTGELVCIASVYGSTWQLLLRSASELKFDGYNPGGGDASLPYYQDFASSFGSYTTFNESGAETWEIDYNTAKMTGFVNSVNHANVDWLISKPISLEGVSNVSFTMTYIARYFNDLNNDITLQVSTDYTDDPTQATWTQVPASWISGSNWTDFASTTVDLSQFVGQKVTVAVRYFSDDQKAGTIEVQSILIQEGNGPTPPPGPAGEVQNIPYTQSFASDFGTYMTYDVLGDQTWEIDYSTAKITGHLGGNPGENYANEDWLISSPVDLSGVNQAKMTMSYIGRYFTNISEEVTVWASTNYTWGADPTGATWKQVPATLREGTNWNDFLTAEIALVDATGQSLAGQTVTFAVKYTSTDNKAGTMEIQSITIEEGGGITPPPGPGGEVQNMPYSQSFATEFGSYTTYDVLGPESWMIDFSTAKMTGYVSQTESHANEDWLISSPVAITGVNDAKMTMVYIGRYFDDINADVTIWASMDYTFGNDPTTATWAHVPATLSVSNSWQNFVTTEIALTDYVGQTVTFAVKYTSRNSRDSFAGTIEVQSITIQEGSAVTPPEPPTPGNPEGSGTAEDPYNVAAGIANQGTQNDAPVAWVKGYIVGSVKSGNSQVTSNDQVNWAAPFDLATNVVIADDPTCREISQCAFVNLPSGKPLRTQVNLMDHPENLGKLLAVNGKLYPYFGKPGVRGNGTENDFVLEGGTPTPPPGPSIYSETFANGQGEFVIENVLMPSELNFVWEYSSQYSCMKASAHIGGANGTNFETESWLVSPAIALTDVNIATLKFDHAANYVANPSEVLTVFVSTNYVDTVDDADWTELVVSAWPSGSDFSFVTATADLSPYIGQTVTIAFKYTSTEDESATWEVKNFVIE